MSHPFARRAGALALTAALFVQQAGALSNISSWAEEGVAAAQAAGLMPSALEALNATAQIRCRQRPRSPARNSAALP